MSYSKREKRRVMREPDVMIRELGLDVVYVHLPSHAVLIFVGIAVVVFCVLVHGV